MYCQLMQWIPNFGKGLYETLLFIDKTCDRWRGATLISHKCNQANVWKHYSWSPLLITHGKIQLKKLG